MKMKDLLADDLFGPEAYARNSDPETSHDAAQQAKANVSRMEWAAARACSTNPNGMTAEQIVALTGIDWNALTPRLAPLHRKGVLAFKIDPETKKVLKRRASTGKMQQVHFFNRWPSQ